MTEIDREYMLEQVDALLKAKEQASDLEADLSLQLSNAEDSFIGYEDAKHQFDQLIDEWMDLPEFKAELERRGVSVDGVSFPEPEKIVKEHGFWGN